MGDLTKDLPKPMVPVKGKPVLEHIVTGLRDEAGITDIFIVTGWCGHVIRDYFGDGSKWNVKIAYGEQAVQDGTGKAPEVAKDWGGGREIPVHVRRHFAATGGTITGCWPRLLRRTG